MKKVILFLGLCFMFASCDRGEKQDEKQECQPVYTQFVVYDGFNRDTLNVLGRPHFGPAHHNDHFTVEWQGEINFATNSVVRILSVY